MNWFHEMSIKRKLIIGFVPGSAIGCAIGLLGAISLNDVNNSAGNTYRHATVPMSHLFDAAMAYQQARVNYREAMLSDNATDARVYATKAQGFTNQFERNLDAFSKSIASSELRARYEKLAQAQAALDPAPDNFWLIVSRAR